MDDIVNFLKKLPKNERNRIMASVIGMTVEQQNENTRIYEASKKYQRLPIKQWPAFEMKWDLTPENRRFALDGYDTDTFKKNYPDGLIVGHVRFQEFHSKLAAHSRRTKEEIWDTGSVPKLGRAILYYVEGNAMTPPFICVDDRDANSVIIGGGYHRIAICLAREVETIPILVMPAEKDSIGRILLSAKWEDE